MQWMRREFLATALASSLARAQSRLEEPWLFIGGYAKGSGQGIWSLRFNTRQGRFGAAKLAAECQNPSFLAVHPRKPVLYAVNEVSDFSGGGALSAFQIDNSSGKLTLMNRVPSKAAGPCHLSLDRSAQTLLAANYGGGSLVACPVKLDGSLGEPASFHQLRGKGPNAARQEASHAHCIITDPGNRYAVATDLGSDRVFVYKLDPAKAQLAPNDPPSVNLQPGAGPRHIVFNPNAVCAYVINELNSTITILDWFAARGAFKVLGHVSTLPAGFKGSNTTAEIVITRNGNYLYASNRGHDSIAVFRVVDGGKRLELMQHLPTRGKTPRNFVLDPTGRWLLAANQDSDSVTAFAVEANGSLVDGTRLLSTPRPTCLRFV